MSIVIAYTTDRTRHFERLPYLRRAVILAALLLLMPQRVAFGITITALSAPTNILRPNDNTVYPFDYRITFTYTRNEVLNAAPVTLSAGYWQDEFADDEVHLTNITVPAPVAGTSPNETTSTATFQFNVGCDLEGIVFGPSGSTGDPEIDEAGLFVFDAVQGNWGHNSVVCGRPAPVSSAPSEMSLIPEPAAGLQAALLLAAVCSRTRHRRGRSPDASPARKSAQ